MRYANSDRYTNLKVSLEHCCFYRILDMLNGMLQYHTITISFIICCGQTGKVWHSRPNKAVVFCLPCKPLFPLSIVSFCCGIASLPVLWPGYRGYCCGNADRKCLAFIDKIQQSSRSAYQIGNSYLSVIYWIIYAAARQERCGIQGPTK